MLNPFTAYMRIWGEIIYQSASLTAKVFDVYRTRQPDMVRAVVTPWPGPREDRSQRG